TPRTMPTSNVQGIRHQEQANIQVLLVGTKNKSNVQRIRY
ncbi:1625_t:CDS:1, partial [Dentiscutata heterogama]